MLNLSKETKVTRVQNAAAAGTSTLTTAAVDMKGYEGVTFVALFGTITDGTPGIKARQGKQSNMSDGADLAGTLTSLATTDDNKCAILDVARPQERYVDCQIIRGGATGAVIDAVLAIQYRAKAVPTTHDATVAKTETHVAPAEGTA